MNPRCANNFWGMDLTSKNVEVNKAKNVTVLGLGVSRRKIPID